jgi:hypothetical protein
MRSLFFALALGRTQPIAVPPQLRLLDRVLMQVGVPDTVEHFAGSFYGVNARVELNMRTRVAMVHLNGAPLGGRISGTGWLHDRHREDGKVVLEPSFEKRLRRRFVTIYRATFDRKRHTVTVGVKIPVIGEIELTLT